MDRFHCEKCGNNVLEEKGRVFFANIWFDCYTCEKCGNRIVLESKNQENTKKSAKFSTISHKNSQNLLSFK